MVQERLQGISHKKTVVAMRISVCQVVHNNIALCHGGSRGIFAAQLSLFTIAHSFSSRIIIL